MPPICSAPVGLGAKRKRKDEFFIVYFGKMKIKGK